MSILQRLAGSGSRDVGGFLGEAPGAGGSRAYEGGFHGVSLGGRPEAGGLEGQGRGLGATTSSSSTQTASTTTSATTTTGSHLPQQLHIETHTQQQHWAKSRIFPASSNHQHHHGSNSFKTEQLTTQADEDQYIDYYYNSRQWWDHATGRGTSSSRGNEAIFPQRQHGHETEQAASKGTFWSRTDKSLKHYLTKSSGVEHNHHVGSQSPKRGFNWFRSRDKTLSQSDYWDGSSPPENLRTLTRAKREDDIKDYDYNPDYTDDDGLRRDISGLTTSGSTSEIHSKTNHDQFESAHNGPLQQQRGSNPLSEFISNWTSTSNSSHSSGLSHDLSTFSHDLTTTENSNNNNTTSAVVTTVTQEFNSSSSNIYGASSSNSTFYNSSSGDRTESLLADSSSGYELSTEFPGYISPVNISFDEGSLPLALEHMFSGNYSSGPGGTGTGLCGEWNASFPLCYPGTTLNTTANASLGEAGDPDGLAPRYWALFLLLFSIFTVSVNTLLRSINT